MGNSASAPVPVPVSAVSNIVLDPTLLKQLQAMEDVDTHIAVSRICVPHRTTPECLEEGERLVTALHALGDAIAVSRKLVEGKVEELEAKKKEYTNLLYDLHEFKRLIRSDFELRVKFGDWCRDTAPLTTDIMRMFDAIAELSDELRKYPENWAMMKERHPDLFHGTTANIDFGLSGGDDICVSQSAKDATCYASPLVLPFTSIMIIAHQIEDDVRLHAHALVGLQRVSDASRLIDENLGKIIREIENIIGLKCTSAPQVLNLWRMSERLRNVLQTTNDILTVSRLTENYVAGVMNISNALTRYKESLEADAAAGRVSSKEVAAAVHELTALAIDSVEKMSTAKADVAEDTFKFDLHNMPDEDLFSDVDEFERAKIARAQQQYHERLARAGAGVEPHAEDVEPKRLSVLSKGDVIVAAATNKLRERGLLSTAIKQLEKIIISVVKKPWGAAADEAEDGIAADPPELDEAARHPAYLRNFLLAMYVAIPELGAERYQKLLNAVKPETFTGPKRAPASTISFPTTPPVQDALMFQQDRRRLILRRIRKELPAVYSMLYRYVKQVRIPPLVGGFLIEAPTVTLKEWEDAGVSGLTGGGLKRTVFDKHGRFYHM